MRKLLSFAAFAALLAAPNAALAQSHDLDWMIGTWTCKNTTPNALAEPAVQTLTATRSATTGAIVWRYTGTNYDQYGFYAYVPATKTWWASWAYPNGGVGNESTKQSGEKMTWTGKVFESSGKSFGVRDMVTVYSPTKFNDTGEENSSGSWKLDYNGTCTKS